MALKNLIRAEELTKQSKKVIPLDYSHIDEDSYYAEKKIPAKEEEEKKTELLQNAQKEADLIIQQAHEEAERIKNYAKVTFDLEKESIEQEYAEKSQFLEKEYTARKEQLEKENAQEREEIQRIRDNLDSELEKSREILKQQIYSELFDKAKEDGIQKASDVCADLVKNVHNILDQAIVKRREMIQEFEGEITDLILLVVQKIVKGVIADDKNVVIRNLHQALTLLKNREHFLIRINTSEIEHVQRELDVIKTALSVKGVMTVVEDTSIEPGGCVIETELGEVDAQITTQLLEVSKRIRELSPIKNVKY